MTTGARDRRADGAAATRRALVDAAGRLFAEHGYAATSLDAIVAAAGLTKGALYQHFSGKQSLFEAVHETVECAGAEEVGTVLAEHDDPWERGVAGLRAYLGVLQQPSYHRIVVQDGHAVLDRERWGAPYERAMFDQLLDIVRAVREAAGVPVDPPSERTYARLVHGALSSAQDVDVALDFVLSGLGAPSAAATSRS